MRLILNGQQFDLSQTLGSLLWWKQHALCVALIMAVSMSLFSLVVVKTQTRQAFIDDQALHYHYSQLEHEYAQLVLEKGAYASQIRVMFMAQDKLHMVMPSPSHIVMV